MRYGFMRLSRIELTLPWEEPPSGSLEPVTVLAVAWIAISLLRWFTGRPSMGLPPWRAAHDGAHILGVTVAISMSAVHRVCKEGIAHLDAQPQPRVCAEEGQQ